MGIIAAELNPTDKDLVAVSLYIRKLAGLPIDDGLFNSMMMELTALKAVQVEEVVNLKTDRDLAVEKIESFETVLADWQRRAKTGSLKRTYETRVLTTFDPGEARFEPQARQDLFL